MAIASSSIDNLLDLLNKKKPQLYSTSPEDDADYQASQSVPVKPSKVSPKFDEGKNLLDQEAAMQKLRGMDDSAPIHTEDNPQKLPVTEISDTPVEKQNLYVENYGVNESPQAQTIRMNQNANLQDLDAKKAQQGDIANSALNNMNRMNQQREDAALEMKQYANQQIPRPSFSTDPKLKSYQDKLFSQMDELSQRPLDPVDTKTQLMATLLPMALAIGVGGGAGAAGGEAGLAAGANEIQRQRALAENDRKYKMQSIGRQLSGVGSIMRADNENQKEQFGADKDLMAENDKRRQNYYKAVDDIAKEYNKSAEWAQGKKLDFDEQFGKERQKAVEDVGAQNEKEQQMTNQKDIADARIKAEAERANQSNSTRLKAAQISATGGAAPGGSTKRQDQALGQITGQLESARGNPEVSQALKDRYASSKATTLYNKYPNPDQMSPQEIHFLVGEVGKIATGGTPSMHELDGINPNAIPQRFASIIQQFRNAPTAANAGAFLKNYKDYADELSKNAEQVINNKITRVIESNKSRLGDQNYQSLKNQYLKPPETSSASTGNTVRVLDPKGNVRLIPKEQVDDAIKAGGKLAQ